MLKTSDHQRAQNNEYKKKHREEMNAYAAKYYQEHKNELNKKRFQKIECICGSTFVRCHKSYHEKTKKHIAFLNGVPKTNREKVQCECGGTYTYHNKAAHIRTNKHQKHITRLN